LFEQAERLDPALPFVQHQLARIEFLEGDFPEALARISTEIESRSDPSPSSYYIRGLVLGFMGRWDDAAIDYEQYLRADPSNWAAINDYAWVLLKAGKAGDALAAADAGLEYWPDNPWLLNSKASALFELGALDGAYESARRAHEAAARVTESDWLEAYPGNDPLIAGDGVAALRSAIEENMHMLERESGRARE
jgi:tetratricopeptide (TPR) repeat protein